MSDEVQLISDGDGMAVIGEPSAVERFLSSMELPSKDLDLQRLNTVMGAGAATLQAGSELSANAGRWVKLTERSARQIQANKLMVSTESGLKLGVVQAKKGGKIKGITEFAKGPTTILTNPAILAGAAGIMAQVAMQQTMDEITDYLAAIDEKVDDVLRAQKDAVLADMVGVDLVIDEAMTIRATVGRVSEVTWSKVQSTSVTIARTQAYALRQLDAVAEKLERKSQVGDVAKAAKDAETKTREWLAVLARCFQLQEAVAVLELDRVLDAAPAELDQHRLALRTARQNRLQVIAVSTAHLIQRMDAAAGTANAKVLMHPIASKSVVESSNDVAADVLEFRGCLGIESGRESLDAKRWTLALSEARDKVVETGASGGQAAMRFGTDTYGRATGVFRSVDRDGDGVADKPRALSAAEDAGTSIKGATRDAAKAVGAVFKRKKDAAGPVDLVEADSSPEDEGETEGYAPASPKPES